MNQFAHRQAQARLKVVYPDGTAAAGRRIQADQISHCFLFGCGAFDAVEMMKTQDENRRAFLRERMDSIRRCSAIRWWKPLPPGTSTTAAG